MNPVNFTNNTKALIAAFVNAILVAILAFGVDLTTDQVGAIMLCVNAGLALFQIATFKRSPKRVAD